MPLSTLPDFHTIHVLVIGDVMLDRYWHGDTSRVSPEAPVPVVHIQEQQARPGGAANVALNIAALGARVTLVGVVGDDEAGQQITQQLQQRGVECALHAHPNATTITKLRVLSRHQQLIRLDFEQSLHANSTGLEALVTPQLVHTDVVVLSDYGKGTLNAPQRLITLAQQAGKPILIDPKGRDFSKYCGATLITPNLSEFEAVVGHCASAEELDQHAEQLRCELDLTALLITRSEHGMSLFQADHAPIHLPAHAREVYDVTGAGDTVIGVLAASLAVLGQLVEATRLANVAAGLVVAKLGAATISPDELAHALHVQQDHPLNDLTYLQTAVRNAQVHGEVVVMTNGCFDILHVGHIHYLQQARQLGDRLIIAVNDDDSVQRLKGANRPINSVAQRMAVLAALGCVDWVIPFGEDTPRDLICALKPDILVKGGDYQVQDIAGHDCVLENGGQVLVLDYVEGCSTTATIAAIQAAQQGEKQ